MDLEISVTNGQQLTYAQQGFTHPPLVLAVDDNEDNLFLLSSILELFGFSWISASDGRAALQLANSHPPDLILLDILLPGINGIDVVRQLRQSARTKEVPIIAVTSLARSEDRERLLEAGFTDYISKPYIFSDLEEVILRHLSWMPSLSCALT